MAKFDPRSGMGPKCMTLTVDLSWMRRSLFGRWQWRLHLAKAFIRMASSVLRSNVEFTSSSPAMQQGLKGTGEANDG